MRIGIPKEIHHGERRVAITPGVTEQLIKLGFEVTIEAQAGVAAYFLDEAYQEAGAHITENVTALWQQSDIVLKVRAPETHPELGVDEVELLHQGQTLISYIWPAQHENLIQRLAEKMVTVLTIDGMPRISRPLKNLFTELCPGEDGEIVVNMDDDLIRAATVVHQGDISRPSPVLFTVAKHSTRHRYCKWLRRRRMSPAVESQKIHSGLHA